MGLKKCENCGEMVDEAKAFCPGCSNPFVVEEKREESSEFDKYAGTVNVSRTALNIMLGDMDLDISHPQEQKNKPVPDQVKPAEHQPPVNVPPVNVPPVETDPNQNNKSGSRKKTIYKVVAAVILLELLVAVFLVWYIYFS